MGRQGLHSSRNIRLVYVVLNLLTPTGTPAATLVPAMPNACIVSEPISPLVPPPSRIVLDNHILVILVTDEGLKLIQEYCLNYKVS